jgi:hypothetical protein
VTARTFATPAVVLLAIIAPGGRASAEGAHVSACRASAIDADGHVVDAATSHASLSRTLPEALAMQMDGDRDTDALYWRLTCAAGALPRTVRIDSTRPTGDALDAITAIAIAPSACEAGAPAGAECGRTTPIRATADLVDRTHPSASGRSLMAEVGGTLTVGIQGLPIAVIPVGGPRASMLGALDRFRARLRFHVVRSSAHGQPAVGGDDDGARRIARAELRAASMLWGQCGIHFGPDSETTIDLVDPPPRYLVGVGCDVGLPASGGKIVLDVEGKRVAIDVKPDDAPVEVAHALAHAVTSAGFSAVVSPNTRIVPGALRTADVLIRKHGGAWANVDTVAGAPLSTDATLPVCLGEVSLGDGLSHFDDLDAVAGTVEERTLVKAYQDDDPGTIDVFVVPSFSKTGRIGESFIDTDGSAIQNVVIVDRAGIRAGSRSYALPHEIGHVLLDMPGHPDDFGVDRPWVLMDADAADATIFGPHRLSVSDCERAVRQSGPASGSSLLVPWPLPGQSTPSGDQKAKRAPDTKTHR